MPPMQPKQKPRWEQEAAEAVGGPRQQDMQPPGDSRHHSKVTVSNPTRGVELEPATTLYRRPQALLLNQSSSSEPKAGPPEGQGRRSEGPASQASGGPWHPACRHCAPGVCSVPSSPPSAARQSPHPWASRHQLHCPLGTKPQNDTHKSRQGAPPGSNLPSEASQKVTRAPRHTWHEQ